MNLSGKFYTPLLTADVANPRVIETPDVAIILLTDDTNRNNLYISGLGGRSLLQGKNLIWSNTKIGRIEYSAPNHLPITGSLDNYPTGVVILAEDSYISGTNYSSIIGGWRNIIYREKEYASGEMVDSRVGMFNSQFSAALNCDGVSTDNAYDAMMFDSTGCTISNSSGIVINHFGMNHHILNACNKEIEGGRHGVVLITDGNTDKYYFNDSRSMNLMFANGVRIFPRINISTDPGYDYINVKDTLDTRVSYSGLYRGVVLSGVSGNPNLSQTWDISNLYTVPNRFTDITIGTSNRNVNFYDLTGYSPVWGNNTAYRYLTESILIGNSNVGANQSLLVGNRNIAKTQSVNNKTNFILNQEVSINPADKKVSIFGFNNYVTGSDTHVIGQDNQLIGGLNNNLIFGIKNYVLQQSGNAYLNADGTISLSSTWTPSPTVTNFICIGNANIEKIGNTSTILGSFNKTALASSHVVGNSNLVSGTSNQILGNSNFVYVDGNSVVGRENVIYGSSNIVVGQFNSNYFFTGINLYKPNSNILIGKSNENTAFDSKILGSNNKILNSAEKNSIGYAQKNTIIGNRNYFDGNHNFGFCDDTYINATGAIGIGNFLTIFGNDNINIGNNNASYSQESVILGKRNISVGKNSVVIGNNGYATNAGELVFASGPFYNDSIGQKTQLSWKGVTTGLYLKSIYLNAKEININNGNLEGMAIIKSGNVLNGTLNMLAVSDKYNTDGKFAARKYNVTLENSGNGVKINNLSLINGYNVGTASNWGIGLTGYSTSGLLMVVSGEANSNLYWHVIGDFNQINPKRFTSGLEKFVDVAPGSGLESTLSISKLIKP